jgi:cyanophycinase
MSKNEVKGSLIAIGGGELLDSDVIINEFIKLAKGKAKAKIVVLTVATEKPKAAGDSYRYLFEKYGVKDISTVDVSQREDAFRKDALERIERATGLFFTGGDQFHITSLMGGTPMHELILEKFRRGTVIAGTSAGAAMMSNSMVLDGRSDDAPRFGSVELASGFDLIPETIIDTHFSQRGRHGRMLAAVAHYPQHIAIGIDEQTGIVAKDGKFRVMGAGVVTVIDGTVVNHSNMAYLKDNQPISMLDVKIHVLPEGYEYDLVKRRPIKPEPIPEPHKLKPLEKKNAGKSLRKEKKS